VHGLEVHPELGTSFEGTSEEHRRFGGYSSLTTSDLVDALNGYAQVLRECYLGDPERTKEVLEEDFPWMCADAV
jgi:hypothetical protein